MRPGARRPPVRDAPRWVAMIGLIEMTMEGIKYYHLKEN